MTDQEKQKNRSKDRPLQRSEVPKAESEVARYKG